MSTSKGYSKLTQLNLEEQLLNLDKAIQKTQSQQEKLIENIKNSEEITAAYNSNIKLLENMKNQRFNLIDKLIFNYRQKYW